MNRFAGADRVNLLREQQSELDAQRERYEAEMRAVAEPELCFVCREWPVPSNDEYNGVCLDCYAEFRRLDAET